MACQGRGKSISVCAGGGYVHIFVVIDRTIDLAPLPHLLLAMAAINAVCIKIINDNFQILR